MNGLDSGPLVRLDDNTFVESSRGNSEQALRFERSDHRIWFDVTKWKISGSAWSDKKVFANRKHQLTQNENLLGSLKPNDKIAEDFSSKFISIAERLDYYLSAAVENQIRTIALISELGTKKYFGSITLSISSAESESGRLLHYDDSAGTGSALWFEAWICKDRMAWLLDEIRCRPNAKTYVSINFDCFRYELNRVLDEFDMNQVYYIESQKSIPFSEFEISVVDRD